MSKGHILTTKFLLYTVYLFVHINLKDYSFPSIAANEVSVFLDACAEYP